MFRTRFQLARHLTLALIATVAITAPAFAQGGFNAYAVTTSERLVQFNTATPCTVSTPVKIEGVDGSILGIDFRPATGQLYALSSSSSLYVINPTTAVATFVATISTALEGTAFGVDFNPTVDRIRIVSNTGQNLRVHPDTGVATTDGRLAYSATDRNAGIQPEVVGAAYTNPDNDMATGTTLYDIDVDLDILAQQNPPNAGTLVTVGSLGVRTNDLVGFDIALGNYAFAALKLAGGGKPTCGNSTLTQINLTTGAAIEIGEIGTAQPIKAFAIFLARP